MALFKRKKKEEPLKLEPEEQEQCVTILGEDEVKEALRAIVESAKDSMCPEIMQATNTCYCPGCENIGKCAIERMARSVGCVGSFPVYCSSRDSKKDEPTYGWAHVVLRSIMPDVQSKYGIKEVSEEPAYGKKKRERDYKRRTKRPDDHTT